MRNKKIYVSIFCVALFFSFKFFTDRKNLLIEVKGRAELLITNTRKSGLNQVSSRPIKETEILAIQGKVVSSPSNVKAPIKRLTDKKITTLTNSDGEFKFRLKPGIYTFFIVQDNNAYLNNFDGNGYYKSHKIYPKMNDILITVTSKSYF